MTCNYHAGSDAGIAHSCVVMGQWVCGITHAWAMAEGMEKPTLVPWRRVIDQFGPVWCGQFPGGKEYMCIVKTGEKDWSDRTDRFLLEERYSLSNSVIAVVIELFVKLPHLRNSKTASVWSRVNATLQIERDEGSKSDQLTLFNSSSHIYINTCTRTYKHT